VDYAMTGGFGNTSDAFTNICIDLSVCTDLIYTNTDGYPSENSWEVLDASGAVIASGVASGDVGACAVLGCTDASADNYDAAATIDDGSCVYPCTLDAVTLILYDSFGDGGQTITVDGVDYAMTGGFGNTSDAFDLCIDLSVCTDLIYTNTDGYPSENSWEVVDASGAVIASGVASGDVGNCFVQVDGCTDPLANNYDALANTDDGTCTYDVLGCTDPAAFNYDSIANVDDGSCVAILLGCIDPLAENYYALANTDDGTCIFLGCTDANADNYDANATVDDGSCTYTPVNGCTDPTADNYDASATNDDGTCIYTVCDAKPTGLNAYDITDTRFRLGWDNMNTASCMVLKYNVRYRVAATATSSASNWTTKSAGAGNGQCNFGLNNVEKLMINFNPSTTYDVRLRVMYCSDSDPSTGWSAWTSSIQVTMADVCPELVNMAVQTFNGQQNKAKFTWDSTGVYMFARLYTRVNGGTAPFNWTIQGGFGIDYPAFSKNIFTFTPGETYRVQGASFCSATMTSYKSGLTPPVIWTQPGGSAKISNGTAINNLDIYPNPSRDLFNVSFTSEDVQNLEVRVLNIVGEVVFVENLEQFVGEYTKQVDLATYTKGVYFLEITTNNGVVCNRLYKC
jgi:hypothetical protein